MEQPSGGRSGGPDRLDTAFNHVMTIYTLYVTQRQNLVNYYSAGIAFLFAAYAIAIDKHRPAAVAICVLGVIISGGAYLNDERLAKLMAAAEDPLAKLQEHLANELKAQDHEVDSLKIQTRVQHVSFWKNRGVVIRAIYGAFVLTFVLGILYAVIL